MNGKMIYNIGRKKKKRKENEKKEEENFGLRTEICTLSGALYVVSANETQLIQGVCAST